MDGSADHQAAQRRAIEGSSGSPQALTLEVDTDYYDALEGSDFDWQALHNSRTGIRVHWADSVVSPKKRRSSSPTESWHDENIVGEELEEYSSWQISLGIANERAALTMPVRYASTQPTARRVVWRLSAASLTHLLIAACRANRRLTSLRRGSSA